MSDSPGAPLADADARRLARERFDVPVLLEAGAGTGKTRALIERLLAWTLDAGWRDAELRLAERARTGAPPRTANAAVSATAGELLDGVVAITFTDAAAAEMASRLGSALATLARGERADEAIDVVDRIGPDRAQARAAALSEQLGRARIQTIHAFCRSLLALHPFDSGLHPAFEVDAESEALERIAHEVISARLAGALAAGDEEWLALLGDGHDPEELLEALCAAAEKGVDPSELEADPYPPERIEALRRAALDALSPLLAALAAVVDSGNRSLTRALAVEPWLAELATRIADPAAPLASISDWIRDDPDDFRKQIGAWADGVAIVKIEALLPAGAEPFALSAERAHSALERFVGLDPVGLGAARRVLAPLLAETRERMRRGGFVLFEELLARAARLLGERADVRAEIRRGIRQLLVDEFQDTDRRQCALVTSLALDGEPATRPGLFVVGDPKQSIYGWRNADLAAYEAFVEQADAAGAVRGRLAVNFRSLPAILDEVDRVLRPALVHEPGLQPAFEPLLPSPENVASALARSGRPAVEQWLSIGASEGAKTKSGAATRIEARSVAADLLEQRRLDPELRWSEVALLARASGDFEVYLQALREAGIPFAVGRDRTYWRRREVIDAAAALRAVIDPGDHLALVTFLRAPWAGVPDAALPLLWRQRLPERIDRLVAPDPAALDELRALLEQTAAALPSGVPGLDRIAGWEASAFAALEALAELRAAFGREPAERFVERFRSRLALEPAAAARFLGRFGVANLERFFRDLETQLADGGGDPVALARFLRSAVAEGRDAREARPPQSETDAVCVMTIHGAKGLEFRHVYLLQVHKGQGGSRERRAFDCIRTADGVLGYSLFEHVNLDWAEAVARRDQLALRERVRLLYVAMTRARERLVIAGQHQSTRDRGGSFLDLFGERFRSSPAVAFAGTGTTVSPVADEQGVLWRAPALEAGWSEAAERRERATPAPFDDPAQLARDLDQLTDRRAAAATRAARPRFLRASELAAFEADDDRDDPKQLPTNQDKGALKGENEKQDETSVLRRAAARARGVALHRALELQPLATRDEEAWRLAARAALVASRPSADADELAELETQLSDLKSSLLWKQLLTVSAAAPGVLGRELPVLAAIDLEDSNEADPTDGFVGALDLLYRDPETGELVVADFKTELLVDGPEVKEIVERYRPQLELYGRAVRAALGLAAPPRLELWLTALDRVVRVEPR